MRTHAYLCSQNESIIPTVIPWLSCIHILSCGLCVFFTKMQSETGTVSTGLMNLFWYGITQNTSFYKTNKPFKHFNILLLLSRLLSNTAPGNLMI